jgi:hypothetical protein
VGASDRFERVRTKFETCKSLRQGSFFAFSDCLHCANSTFDLAFEFAFTNLQWPQKLKMPHGFMPR